MRTRVVENDRQIAPFVVNMFSLLRTTLILCVLGGAIARPAAAPAGQVPYIVSGLEMKDSLPLEKVRAVRQTRDGYLWLATASGLGRLDGLTCKLFAKADAPRLPSNLIDCLLEDHAGSLWLGSETGEVFVREATNFVPIALPAQWPKDPVVAMVEDRNHTVWIRDSSGDLMAIRGVQPGPIIKGALPPDKARAATTNLLVCDAQSVAWTVNDSTLRPLTEGVPSSNEMKIPARAEHPLIFPARAQGFWVADGNWLRRWNAGTWVEDRGQHDLRSAIAGLALETGNGDVILPTSGDGLHIIDRQGVEKRPGDQNALGGGSINCLCEDREGNLWVGAGNGGLKVIRPRAVTMVEPPDHWMNQPVVTVTQTSQGGLFIGAEGASVYHFENGLFASLSRIQSNRHLAIRALYEDDRNTLWIGTRGAGLWRESQGDFQPVEPAGDFSAPINSIFESRSNALWFGTEEGPVQFKNGQWDFLARRFSLVHPDTRCFAEGPDGAIWFGMQGGGIGRFRDGKLAQFGQGSGLAGDYVWSLLAEPDGTLWIGTYGSGLCRFKAGKFATVSTKNGLPSDVICSLIDDHDGNFWISSYAGVFRVNQAALDRCADSGAKLFECLTFGLGEGLLTLELAGGIQPAACRTPDGKLWYPSSKGLAVVDPGAIRNNVLAPPVAISEILVDGEPFDAAGLGHPVNIGPGHRYLEFRYVGLSLTAPEQVSFKYRMEGLQTDWVEPGNRRSAYYSYLPAGSYEFHVLACNQSGVWNETGASLAVVVHPYFWQTWWFLSGTGLAVLIGVAAVASAISHQRERRRREEAERQRTSEQERTRIARDIHDQLGIGLTRISMLSLSASNPPAARTPQNLAEIYQTTNELTRAMDEIVWAVNPRHDSLDSLLAYLGGYARKFLETAGISCRLCLPMDVPRIPLSAEARHHIFLAFQEILNNVVKHAAAHQVSVAAELKSPELILSVTDDGKGFAGSAAAAGSRSGNGLANIEHRLSALGGRVVCTSRAGSGTTIQLIFPIQS